MMQSSAEARSLRGRQTPLNRDRRSVLHVERQTGSTSRFSEVHARMLRDQSLRATGELQEDRLLLFTPTPTVTLGSAATAADLLLSKEDYEAKGVSISEVDRGGEATYHGPGQRVGYFNVLLAEEERDLHSLIRRVEAGLIGTLESYRLGAKRISGKTGVWIGDRKIASIGLSVRRWVTGHGFSLCVSGDLKPFSWIVPCGIENCAYTTIEAELGTIPDADELDQRLAHHLAAQLDRRIANQ